MHSNDPPHPVGSGTSVDPVRQLTQGCRYLGTVGYHAARELQEELVRARAGAAGDSVLILQHPPCITLGRRTCPADLALSERELAARGVDLFRTERGGSATFHAPGQLVIYPVVSLKERGIGVRRFVEEWLGILGSVVSRYGPIPEVRLEPAGLWLGELPPRKIAACGLRITEGITNHGFSLNVNLSLEPFQWFVPCGIKNAGVTSLSAECQRLGLSEPRIEEVAGSCAELIGAWLDCTG